MLTIATLKELSPMLVLNIHALSILKYARTEHALFVVCIIISSQAPHISVQIVHLLNDMILSISQSESNIFQ